MPGRPAGDKPGDMAATILVLKARVADLCVLEKAPGRKVAGIVGGCPRTASCVGDSWLGARYIQVSLLTPGDPGGGDNGYSFTEDAAQTQRPKVSFPRS